MALSLLNKGYSVYTYRLLDKITHKNHTSASGLDELMKKCQVLIGPIPLTKDIVTISSSASNSSSSCNIADLLNKDHMLIGGVIPQDLEDLCENKGIFCYDLMRSDKIAIMNAIATAEGTILEAIKNSDRNIHTAIVLSLDMDARKVLADKLKGLDAKVTIAARREASLAYAQAAGFNTVLLDDIKSVLPKFHFIFNTIPSWF